MTHWGEVDAWLLQQVDAVHYRQDGDNQSICGDKWSKSTTAKDFLTCEECRRILGMEPRKKK